MTQPGINVPGVLALGNRSTGVQLGPQAVAVGATEILTVHNANSRDDPAVLQTAFTALSGFCLFTLQGLGDGVTSSNAQMMGACMKALPSDGYPDDGDIASTWISVSSGNDSADDYLAAQWLPGQAVGAYFQEPTSFAEPSRCLVTVLSGFPAPPPPAARRADAL